MNVWKNAKTGDITFEIETDKKLGGKVTKSITFMPENTCYGVIDKVYQVGMDNII